MKRALASLGAGSLLCMQVSSSAHGYVFMSDPPASGYAMNLDLGAGAVQTTGYGATTWNALAQNAMAAWNQVGIGPQQDHKFFSVKTPAVSGSACAQDGVNEVTFSSTLCGLGFGSALAVTKEWSVNGQRVEEDMVFDSTRSWDAYTGPLQATKWDFYRVALHEFGHVVGLDHPDEWGQTKQSLMNSVISDLYTIQQDDIDGAHLINWYWFNFQTKYGVALNTPVTSNTITFTGLAAPASISVTGGGQYSIDGGAYTSAAGTISNGQTVTLRVTSSAAAMTATTATLTIGAASGDFSAITAGNGAPIVVNTSGYRPLVDGSTRTYRNNGVDGYTRTVLAGATLINGIATKAVQDSDGEISYSTNDANGIRSHRFYDTKFFMPGLGAAPLTVTMSPPLLHAPVSATLGQAVNSTGTANYVIPSAGIDSNLSYSSSTTLEAFETITVPAGTFNTIRVRSISSLSGTLNGNSINQTANETQWVANGVGTVKNVVTSSDVNTYLLTGGTGITVDATPDPFSFAAQTGAQTSSAIASSPITISGINTPSTITIVGGEYGINGGAYTSVSGTVNNGDVVTVRLVSSNAFSTTLAATLTVGGVNAVFSVTTAPSDTVPDAFSFAAQTGVQLATTMVSAPVSISGINAATPISVSGGEYSINGGAYTTVAGTVNNGDIVTVRLTSSGLYNTAASATLTVGGVSGIFRATTNNNPTGTIVRLQTSLGPVDVALFDNAAPLTVANFMNYVNSGAYSNSFIHRSVPGFVIQGGGYTWNSANSSYYSIAANPPVINEFSPTRSNLRGTVAMAKLGSDPNSATTQWFINLADNSANLDAQNGGFTVFGQVINGMQVVDAIAALPTTNAGGAFTNLPLATTPAGGSIQQSNLVMVNSVSKLPSSIALSIAPGWNLLGNGIDSPLNVSATLGDATKVATVWKWIPATSKWAFFTPSLAGQALTDYVASKGYDVLTTINGGEGFWVNAKGANTINLPPGNAVPAASFQSTLSKGWNLVAIGEAKTPSQFNVAIGAAPASPIPINLTTLWAWEPSQPAWYFYAPSLEANGTLSSYITSKNYLDFTANSKTLGQGVGFWVNKP